MPPEPVELDPETAAGLLRRQDELQAEAREIVRDLDLLAILGQAGPVAEHGSALSGLMAWPDLDFGVTSPGPRLRGRATVAHPSTHVDGALHQ